MMTERYRDEAIVKFHGRGPCSYICKLLDFDAMKDIIKNFEFYWARISEIPAPRDYRLPGCESYS